MPEEQHSFAQLKVPLSQIDGRVDSGAIMIGGGESREAGGGDGRDDVQGDEDDVMGSQDGVPIPPIPSSGSKHKLFTDDNITGDLISFSKSPRTSTTSFSSCKLKPKSVAGVMADCQGNSPLLIVLLSIPFPSSFYPHSLHLY
jgi:hypothetical protein